MIRIAILAHNTDLLDNIASTLQQPSFATTTTFDTENLSAWLAKHGVDMLVLPSQNENERATTAFISKSETELLNGNGQSLWQLNSSQLELVSPNGRPIPLSHNECCILRASANANGNVVSRKTLIEALGQDFWHYDERRLESLISRLRRKLAACAPEDFSIRGVKGQGYLFGVALRIVEI